MSILIFDAEKEAGLSDVIAKARAISYLAPVSPANFTVEQKDFIRICAEKTKTDIDVEGLYPTQSILVSTVWNLNDDVFDKYETWLARSTPNHKPTNNNHNESEIIGHMIGSWAIDEDGELIDGETSADSLPDVFHILNSAVIYTAFSEPDLIARAKKIIEEIEAGTKFVSMEAYFRGFDYAVMDAKGVMQIVQRNEKTAFLTKHLRAYGGKGEYEGNRIGRLLRNITFTGKGYVDTPANPGSIIFDKNTTFKFISKGFVKELKITSGVCINQNANNGESNTMSTELETKIADLTNANQTLTVELGTVKSERESFLSQINDLTTAKTSLQAKIDELTVANQTLVAEVNTFKANEVKSKRTSVLVAGGFTAEEADAKVILFANLNDEQFSALAAELVEAKKFKFKKEDEKDKKEESGAKLADVTPEPVIVPTAPDVSSAAVREGLATIFEGLSNMNKPTKKTTKSNQNA